MTLTIGFLGCGLIAHAHARGLRDVGDAAITKVFDIDADRAQAFAAETGGQAASSVEDVIQSCDAVYVTTWTSEHPHLVSQVVGAGKAVFCEKPLGVDLATARSMFNEVQASGVVNQVGLVLRHSPSFRWLQHQMSSGDFGERMSLMFRDDQYIPVQGMYGSTWRGDIEKAGAGTLLEHSIHDLDLIEWIMGPITRVSCVTANVHGIDGIEDQANVMLTTSSGATAMLSSTWHDVLTRPSQRHVEGFCRNAHLGVLGDWAGPVTISSGATDEKRLSGDELAKAAAAVDGRSTNPDADFVASVRNNRAAFPDFGVAVRAHVLADAAYRSAAAGGTPTEV